MPAGHLRAPAAWQGCPGAALPCPQAQSWCLAHAAFCGSPCSIRGLGHLCSSCHPLGKMSPRACGCHLGKVGRGALGCPLVISVGEPRRRATRRPLMAGKRPDARAEVRGSPGLGRARRCWPLASHECPQVLGSWTTRSQPRPTAPQLTGGGPASAGRWLQAARGRLPPLSPACADGLWAPGSRDAGQRLYAGPRRRRAYAGSTEWLLSPWCAQERSATQLLQHYPGHHAVHC